MTKPQLAKYVIKKDNEVVEFFGDRLKYWRCCNLNDFARLRIIITGFTIDSIAFNEAGLEYLEINCIDEKLSISDVVLLLIERLTIIEHKNLSHER